MSFNFENPFADYGNIVRGERFIGRKDSLKVINSRIIWPKEAGNLAIIGEPRIGKSSLVYKAIIEHKSELVSKNLLPIWINLGTYDKSAIFFRALVTECMDEMEDLDWLTELIQRAANRFLEAELTWSEGFGKIQKFFEKVRKAGYRILFILDEFDHARHLFKGDIAAFQGLRELSYRPEWRVTYITTSRRSIRDIEQQSGAISTFDGIFHKHYLAMFNNEDLEEFFRRLSSIVTLLSSSDKEIINYYCGGHPFLLEMLGYEIIEVFREEHKADLNMAVNHIKQSFLEQYDRIADLLREDDSLNKLIQILFGPIVNVKQIDIDDFLRYGLIKLSHNETYVGFSDHFHLYLKMIEHETGLIDLWPTWSNTEKALRNFITTKMFSVYGENWIEKLEQTRRNLEAIFDRCRKAQQKEEKTFGSRASRNLIDFTYPQDLFAIVFAEWNHFKSIFGRDKNYWDQRAQLLSKIRNPIAHNRDESLYDYERQIADGYCKEILELISSF